jgi:dethiobiotin synthetase
LGCINQALLTHEAMRTRGLQVMGWVANSTQQTMPFEAENIAAIQERMNVPLLGHIPYLAHGQVSQAASYLTLPKLV